MVTNIFSYFDLLIFPQISIASCANKSLHRYGDLWVWRWMRCRAKSKVIVTLVLICCANAHYANTHWECEYWYEVNIVNVVRCRDIEAILSVLVCWYGKVDIVNIVGILRRYYQQEQSVCSAATSSASWSLLLVLSTCSNAASLLLWSSSYQYLK